MVLQSYDVAQAFVQIERESSRTEMTKMIADLFSRATPEEAEIIANLSLGQLRPPYRGTKFNFAEKGLAAVLAEVLSLSPAAITKKIDEIGDLGSVIPEDAWKASESLTLKQLYKALEEFEQLSGSGSVEEKSSALAKLLLRVDPLMARYVVRIIAQNLRLGFSEMTIIDALSWMLAGDKSLRDRIEYAFNVSADIGLIAKVAREGGIDAIDHISITVGIPIRPAAAERLPSAAAIIEKLGPCIAQPKFDGFRLQVHIFHEDGERKIKFFSRNLLDMSAMFPDLVAALKDVDVDDLVVEGEALAYDEQTDSYRPFQETVKRKRKHDIGSFVEELPLRLVLFDILYCNGTSLLESDEKERYRKLKEVVKGVTSSNLAVTEQVAITNADELERYFTKNITAGLEGVVVKRPDAQYQPGKRNFNWIKLKRSQQGALDDTIDVVVLGYYAGRGKRASFGIGALLVGVYNEQEDRFETIAKIGTGLTDAGFVEIKARCDKHKVHACPHNVVVAKELTPDVWVSPDFVIVIKADEITRSPLHTAGKNEKNLGLALRFPRFIDYRPDKAPTEATSVEEIQTLFEQQRAAGAKE